jgi:hypothetical protein
MADMRRWLVWAGMVRVVSAWLAGRMWPSLACALDPGR